MDRRRPFAGRLLLVEVGDPFRTGRREVLKPAFAPATAGEWVRRKLMKSYLLIG